MITNKEAAIIFYICIASISSCSSIVFVFVVVTTFYENERLVMPEDIGDSAWTAINISIYIDFLRPRYPAGCIQNLYLVGYQEL